jgi:type II secretory pathway component PulL
MLRVFLAAPPSADRAEPWVRYGSDRRAVARGRDIPARWPSDASVEVVVAAALTRVVALALPPMPRNRLPAAVRYALEDQMATSADDAAIAVTTAEDGVIAAIATRQSIGAIRASIARVARIVPESALAPRSDGWTWCASAADGGFVRRADGSAFAVGGSDGDALPPELDAALAAAAHGGAAPAAVHVARSASAQQLAHWSRDAGVQFVAAPVWRWDEAPAAAFAAAPDFLATDAPASAPAASHAARAFRPALAIATAALALLATGLLVERAWLAVDQWRASRALVQEAASARLPDASTPAAAAAAIARANAQARHRAGKAAPGDAVPLLARAAPAIATLPAGALKSATYANDAWTLELANVDAQSVSRVARALAHAGIDAVSAPTAGGVRMRLALGVEAK